MHSLQRKDLALAGAFLGLALASQELPSLESAPATVPSSARPLAQYQHRSWSVADGLPQAGTRSMVEAQDGFLWMTTAEGLARFDGLSFDVWDQYRDPAIRNHEMPFFLQAPDGTFSAPSLVEE